ncbi:MAG: ribose-5-phosphate isomerase RpiA [Thermotogota bacterium]
MDAKGQLKKLVAKEVLEYIESDMVVGLGSGSTMACVIKEIGQAIESKKLKRLYGVPTSFQSEILGRENHIQILNFNVVEKIDLAIDGADEVTSKKLLIKGGGGAHTREKYIDYFADRFIVVADESKLVQRLGQQFPVPVEVLPDAYKSVQRGLLRMNGIALLRMAEKKAGPVITDQGNFILDTKFDSIIHPKRLEMNINNIPGVLENGIFTAPVELVLIGSYSNGKGRVIRI